MVQQVINEIVPVVITCLISVITIIIKSLGDAAVAFIQAKKNAEIAKMGVEKYNNELAVAKNVWNIVDEYFRITPTVEKTIDSAQAKFKEEILKKIPYLTDADIEHLRQVVAGEINKGKDVIVTPAAAVKAKASIATTVQK
ncbi:hypothetical protein [Clostridium oryzae]|uniref:Phage holin protein n=1 Tax=Clostridium oryzae TaxID=1450648 RepID=A0A1V4IGR0_9CLOT|nr:hypothetical protein [Clostridium oryzae]OPJ59109.1 hypothetical protein CLORY_34380 [Clostridium oryzae]